MTAATELKAESGGDGGGEAADGEGRVACVGWLKARLKQHEQWRRQ